MPTRPARACTGSPTCPNPAVSRGYCQVHAAQQEHARGNYDVRRLYRRARWIRLRAQVLDDNPLCVECQQEHPPRVTIATDVHHRERHGGDLTKFYDRTGLEGLCARHHAAHTARGE